MTSDDTANAAMTPLNLRFKGTRTYLHGTDLFDAMLELTGSKRDICMNVFGQMLTQVAALPIEPTAKRPKAAAADFFSDKGRWTILPTGAEVTGRYPYDETALASRVRVDGNLATGPVEGVSLIEALVAYNKRLLQETTGIADWWFARVELARLPETIEDVALVLGAEGGRLRKSVIRIAGEPLGALYFHVKTAAD